MTGLWLENCQACAIPEIASVFNRSGIKYDIITGHLKDESAWKEIASWVEAVKVCRQMRGNRLGLLGHYYCGMLDVYTDLMKVSSVFGTHVEIVEMDELAALRRSATEEEIGDKLDEFRNQFKVSESCSEYELRRAATTSVALDKLVKAHDSVVKLK